ncbi:hypothetical protein Ddye_022029 [Dipteronia dyeriana]|uniref:valine--tRNA ligase n=1 Tax=Dipteronia dyeriana TaxID=168575 RepID=A0AAD9U3R5_9ROSI|nr:hypothetical protein Ddye_022029 [Dipteronia dyeriana]
MICDAHGHKMSKSLGNIIDPIEIINGISLDSLHNRLEEGNLDPKELDVAKAGLIINFPHGIAECGADALRFALISYTTQSFWISSMVQQTLECRSICYGQNGEDYVPPNKYTPGKYLL